MRFFIDEIQYSKESGKHLKYIYDNYKVKLIISGSSATEVSLQSLKYLVGRVFIFTLYPFSFDEYLRATDESLERLYLNGKFGEEIKKELNNNLWKYSIWGGYPRVVLSKSDEERQLVLENIYSTYVMKDVKPLFGLKDDYKWLKLLKALSLQLGNLINYNELATISELDYYLVKQYLNILKKSYICEEVSPFFTNKRLELVKATKIYFCDSGLRNSIINNFSYERGDMGALLENFVFSEMVKRGYHPKYWRSKSGAEVDFIFERNKELLPTEVKTTATNVVPKSTLSFIKKYSPKNFLILSQNLESKRRIENTNVIFLPLVKFYSREKSIARKK